MLDVPFKTIERIMIDVCEFDEIDIDDLEFYTDIQVNDKYVIRAYEQPSDRTIFIIISYNHDTKRYNYDLKTCDGNRPEYYKNMSV